MSVKDPQLLEAIRRQFDSAPYPRVPIEDSPKDDPVKIFIHSIQTPYYLRDQRVIDPKDRVILDAGCGSGVKSLALAIANPGAHIVSLDLSPESVNVARHRLEYHGIENVEFHALSIYDLPQLGITFDYINCDEVLYSLPDPAAALQVMQSVLKPDGIIRANLHSRIQRQRYYRGQQIFREMGLFEDGPTGVEAAVVREFMQALDSTVEMKLYGWNEKYEVGETSDEIILMNYLLAGDTGFTIPDAFKLMGGAGLEFISMLHWKKWDLLGLLKDPDHLPTVWQQWLVRATDEDRLRLFELLHPLNRLIDFWCGNPRSQVPTPLDQWDQATWESARVYLHPFMRTDEQYQTLSSSVDYMRPAEILYEPYGIMNLMDSTAVGCILALWDGALTFSQLVDHHLRCHPLDPITLTPCDRAQIASLLKAFLKKQAKYAVFLIEPALI
jgi:ubiquinone/menaquinone biosynthesis C-methylase UbiE